MSAYKSLASNTQVLWRENLRHLWNVCGQNSPKEDCFIFHCSFSPSSATASLKLPPLCNRRDKNSLKLLHSFVHSSSNDNYVMYDNTLATRRGHILTLKPFFAHTNIFKFSFFPRFTEHRNDLPGRVCEMILCDYLEVLIWYYSSISFVLISLFVEALMILLFNFFPFVFMYPTPAIAVNWAAVFENK